MEDFINVCLMKSVPKYIFLSVYPSIHLLTEVHITNAGLKLAKQSRLASIKHLVLLLLHPPECWDYTCAAS